MKSFTFQHSPLKFAVFGSLLASLSQSIYGQTCDGELADVVVEIKTDNFSPRDVSWSITECDGTVVGERNDFQDLNIYIDTVANLCTDRQYVFSVMDSGGDPDYGAGFFNVYLDSSDGEVLLTGSGYYGSGVTRQLFNGVELCFPTDSPSQSPTLAPTTLSPTVSCDSDLVDVVVKVSADLWPDEISWVVTDCDGNVVGERNDFPCNVFPYFDFYIDTVANLCPDRQYVFSISDSDGNGAGRYKIYLDSLDGELLFNESGDYGFGEQKQLFTGVELCPTESPSQSPTVSCDSELADVVVELFTDGFWGQNSWRILDSNGMIVDERSRATFSEAYTLYSDTVVGLCPDIQYLFDISDSGGDGICCRAGDGYYNIIVDGEVLFTGGDFRAEETVPFFGESPGSCIDNPDPFTFTAELTCKEVANEKEKVRDDLCNSLPGNIKANCPNACETDPSSVDEIVFDFFAETSCNEIQNSVSKKTLKLLCKDEPYGLSERCPQFCGATDSCPCVDSIFQFKKNKKGDKLTCKELDGFKRVKKFNACLKNKISKRCPGVCEVPGCRKVTI